MTNTPNPADAVEVTLKPCPFCATTEHLSVSPCGSMTADMPSRPHRVVCWHIDHDEVAGPVAYGKYAAIEAWNSRPLASSTPEPVAATQAPDAVERAKAKAFFDGFQSGERDGFFSGYEKGWSDTDRNPATAWKNFKPHSTLPTADARPVAWITEEALSLLRENKAVKYSDIVPTKQRDWTAPLYATPPTPNADLVGLVKRLRSLATGLPRKFQVQVVTEIADALEALSREGSQGHGE